ncbi:MAG: hypothetical protein ACI9XB_003927 [Gammaproteobacteria bacterium]|jgi:hypothetical protein
MKSKILITTVMLCFASMVSMAEDLSVFSVKVADKSSFVLKLTNIKQAKIQVTLKDEKGATLYNETLMQASLDQKKYDIGKLSSGNYTLVVAYDAVIKVQPIKKGKVLEIEAEDLQTIFQPCIRQHSQYLDLDMLCLSDLKISLKITDVDGNVIYKELVQPKGSLQRRFNFSTLEYGLYSFTLIIEDPVLYKEFSETIVLSPVIAGL